jgi:hypothetical protein
MFPFVSPRERYGFGFTVTILIGFWHLMGNWGVLKRLTKCSQSYCCTFFSKFYIYSRIIIIHFYLNCSYPITQVSNIYIHISSSFRKRYQNRTSPSLTMKFTQNLVAAFNRIGSTLDGFIPRTPLVSAIDESGGVWRMYMKCTFISLRKRIQGGFYAHVHNQNKQLPWHSNTRLVPLSRLALGKMKVAVVLV